MAFGGPNQNFTFGQVQDPNAGRTTHGFTSRDQALAFVGQPPGTSLQGNLDRDLDAYYGTAVSGRNGDYSVYGDSAYVNNLGGGGSASGGFNGQSSIDGISAVNPQAGQANELDAFRRYEDAAYGDAMRYLQPQLDASQRQFDQQMAGRGIPIGSEAYNVAKAEFEKNKAGALQGAAFGAMQFGLGAQNQSFQQDHARSALANALLQAQWQKELGWGNIGLGHANLGLQQNRLDESSRQFDQSLGFQRDSFYDTMDQRNYEFDSNMDYNIWDRGNYWDFAHDRADASDYFGAWDRDYRSQQDFTDLVANLFGRSPGNAGLNTQYNPYPGSPYDWSWMF